MKTTVGTIRQAVREAMSRDTDFPFRERVTIKIAALPDYITSTKPKGLKAQKNQINQAEHSMNWALRRATVNVPYKRGTDWFPVSSVGQFIKGGEAKVELSINAAEKTMAVELADYVYSELLKDEELEEFEMIRSSDGCHEKA